MSKSIKLTWYGRCCFLIELNDKKILIDPHDSFDGVEMGRVDADYTLISSTWHDHGNIAASPDSIILSSAGITKVGDITITGIHTKESRGTDNIIFNVQFEDYSITNFADLGDPDSLTNLTAQEKEVLASTNIAFVRPNIIDKEPFISSGELALQTCKPKILIPHHYYPKQFIDRIHALENGLAEYLPKIDNMITTLNYTKQIIDGYSTEIDINELPPKTALLFSDIHPQVTFKIN